MKRQRKRSPYLTIIASFLCVILIGSLLLMLPFSITDYYKEELGQNHLGFIDALFTSTSAVCVTGLTVIPNPGLSLTFFGKVILMLLIEIGGLSILTLTIFIFTILGVKLSIADRFMMKEALNQNSASGIVKLVRYIIIITLSIQGLTALFNFFIFVFATPGWNEQFNFFETVGISIFHSISSFNNAGFDIFGFDSSMQEAMFANNFLLNINTIVAIVLGGLGFIVIYDIIRYPKTKRLSLHSKIVLPTTFCIIFVGTIVLKILEPNMNWLQAIFNTVCARTAGFSSYDLSKLNSPSQIIYCFIMFIGASPSSTGGGVKTTTLFIVILFIISFARGKQVVYCHRRISNQSILKAFSLLSFALTYILIAIFGILIVEQVFMGRILSLGDVIFETVSAFSTTGASRGFMVGDGTHISTSELGGFSKLILSLSMFLGRVGPLTFTSLFNKNWIRGDNEEIQYIEEKIIIG